MNILQWCFRKAEQCSVFFISNMRMAATLYSTSNMVLDDRSKSGSASEAGDDKPDKRNDKRHTFMVVGLGNHGFPDTRHSVGMRAVNRLAAKLSVSWDQSTKQNGGFLSYAALGDDEKASPKLVLFKPKALMNINGVSVAKTAKLLEIPPHNIFLIHDELDRNVGKFQIKEGGSAGGHNGVLSCMSSLKSNEMLRLRIGISRPATKSLVVPYVLSNFSHAELAAVDVAIDQALDSLLDYIKRKVDPNHPDLVTKSRGQQAEKNVRKKSRRQRDAWAEMDATTESDSERRCSDGGIPGQSPPALASIDSKVENGEFASECENFIGNGSDKKEMTSTVASSTSKPTKIGSVKSQTSNCDDGIVDR